MPLIGASAGLLGTMLLGGVGYLVLQVKKRAQAALQAQKEMKTKKLHRIVDAAMKLRKLSFNVCFMKMHRNVWYRLPT